MNDITDKFENYISSVYGYFEGTDGVRDLSYLCARMGYNKGQFIGADPILNFLADNSGAMEAIIEFIRDNISGVVEWQEGLELDMIEDEDEDT